MRAVQQCKVPGSRGENYGTNIPQVNDEHHFTKRLRLSSDAGGNRQQRCECFYIGDEVAVTTRYRVCGKSKSERLFERRG